jgi:hypothetical protein
MYKRKKQRPSKPEQTPFSKTYESEADAAANQKRGSRLTWDYEESKSPKQPELINIEFFRLAFCFMPEAHNDPKLAHKMAWEFLEAGYTFFLHLAFSQDVFRERLQMYAREDGAELRA